MKALGRRRRLRQCCAVAVGALFFGVPFALGTELLVSAATSLTDALETVRDDYQQDHPDVRIRYNFAASGVLEQQIRRGAPVDVFISASLREMDALERDKLIDPATRFDVCSNKLVLIGPAGTPLKRWEELWELRTRRIAIGNPAYVPAGHYARQTFEKLKLWSNLQKNFVYGESARQTLAYVQNGDAQAGVVFYTDAKRARGVTIIADAPAGSHDPIVYPAAMARGAKSVDVAKDFLRYLRSPQARPAFHVAGFLPPPEQTDRKGTTATAPASTSPGKPQGASSPPSTGTLEPGRP